MHLQPCDVVGIAVGTAPSFAHNALALADIVGLDVCISLISHIRAAWVRVEKGIVDGRDLVGKATCFIDIKVGYACLDEEGGKTQDC